MHTVDESGGALTRGSGVVDRHRPVGRYVIYCTSQSQNMAYGSSETSSAQQTLDSESGSPG
jgi:hypothetical protein